ncbi:hypothetical protein [Phenylobacterium deserti]|uniref:Uncharacterized protein n=1 Tax=Phenylobacterium deserti TaxID=1914756 RepID=A0A328A8K4_9CAUL|nr:hypothetical protein [Phenylobacterium deserti]RAK50880.1 hypothetical protein DJ018_17060 [Phenylobacterium deserti]
MRNTLVQGKPARARHVPRELVAIVGFAAAIFAVVGAGSMISAALPDPVSPWLVASAYLAPASMAFAIYWWIAQRN